MLLFNQAEWPYSVILLYYLWLTISHIQHLSYSKICSSFKIQRFLLNMSTFMKICKQGCQVFLLLLAELSGMYLFLPPQTNLKPRHLFTQLFAIFFRYYLNTKILIHKSYMAFLMTALLCMKANQISMLIYYVILRSSRIVAIKTLS